MFFAAAAAQQGRCRCILPRPSGGGQCSRSSACWTPGPSRLLLEGDVTATRSSFIFSAAASVFLPLSVFITSWSLVSEYTVPAVARAERPIGIPSHRCGLFVVVEDGWCCICSLESQSRFSSLFVASVTSHHNTVILHKPRRAPSPCLRPVASMAARRPKNIRDKSPAACSPLSHPCKVRPKKGGPERGHDAFHSGTPIRAVQDRGSASQNATSPPDDASGWCSGCLSAGESIIGLPN